MTGSRNGPSYGTRTHLYDPDIFEECVHSLFIWRWWRRSNACLHIPVCVCGLEVEGAAALPSLHKQTCLRACTLPSWLAVLNHAAGAVSRRLNTIRKTRTLALTSVRRSFIPAQATGGGRPVTVQQVSDSHARSCRWPIILEAYAPYCCTWVRASPESTRAKAHGALEGSTGRPGSELALLQH